MYSIKNKFTENNAQIPNKTDQISVKYQHYDSLAEGIMGYLLKRKVLGWNLGMNIDYRMSAHLTDKFEMGRSWCSGSQH